MGARDAQSIPCLSISTYMKNRLYSLLLAALSGSNLSAQDKQDYNWILGYGQTTISRIMRFDFGTCASSISLDPTPDGFWMEGSNTSMSDTSGNLLFYSNGCCIVNSEGEVMDNGDGINPGLIENIYCPAGGSPHIQGVIAIPYPGNDKRYYVFNLDMDLPYFMVDGYLGVAPEKLYYQVVDMTESGGLGKIIQKNQVAIQDTFARGSLKAVRHANGTDWWLIVPKSHSNCYFISLITAQGVQPPILECEGRTWNDLDASAQTVFMPNGKKYIRCNKANGLNILDFNDATGDLSNPISIDFPNDTFTHGGVSVSANSRFLYMSARKKLYQFDLTATDIEASRIQVGEWNGFSNPYPTIFYLSALAPDNKIYISSTSSHGYLHVIHNPDSLGLACNLEQRGLVLPSYNYATIPNFPHYRATSNQCDSTMSSSAEPLFSISRAFTITPNPATSHIVVRGNIEPTSTSIPISIYNITGQEVLKTDVREGESIDISKLQNGIYFLTLKNAGTITSRKLIKTE
jgi:Secretion system C-terminal sorting domain